LQICSTSCPPAASASADFVLWAVLCLVDAVSAALSLLPHVRSVSCLLGPHFRCAGPPHCCSLELAAVTISTSADSPFRAAMLGLRLADREGKHPPFTDLFRLGFPISRPTHLIHTIKPVRTDIFDADQQLRCGHRCTLNLAAQWHIHPTRRPGPLQ
jgi:hypothetical protein